MFRFSLIRDRALVHQPTRPDIAKWLRSSLQKKFAMVTLSISIVDQQISQRLNLEYRNKDYPTNVISLEYPQEREEFNLLSGELILCDQIIVDEAIKQNKPIIAHYAHMVIHGMLHLQGFDHIEDNEAELMERIEIDILTKHGFNNPYLEQ